VRRVVMAAVTPKAVREAEPAIEAICRSIVALVPQPGRVDLQVSWAATIPSRAIGHLLGFPDEDHEKFYSWTKAYIAYLAESLQGEVPAERQLELQGKMAAFNDYVTQHIRRRQGDDAPDDAITRMIRGNAEGAHMDDPALVGNIIFLLMAGNTTTQSLLTNTILHLVKSGTYREIRMNRHLLAAAVEESLRVAPPINYVVRVPDEDLRVGGLIIPAGQAIAVGNLSANHDETVWGVEAASFSPDREHASKHLAFASGPHSCIGAALARTVAHHAINALLDRFESIELVPEFRWQRRDLWTTWGGKGLDVTCVEDPMYLGSAQVPSAPPDDHQSRDTLVQDR
jgi:cytochrome P450